MGNWCGPQIIKNKLVKNEMEDELLTNYQRLLVNGHTNHLETTF